MILQGLKKFENDPKLSMRIGVLIMEWERTYPHIDVRSQIQWAHCWLLENPNKDKKNYIRFLGNWMRGAEKRALEKRTNVIIHPKYVDNKPNEDELMTLEDIQKMKEAIRK